MIPRFGEARMSPEPRRRASWIPAALMACGAPTRAPEPWAPADTAELGPAWREPLRGPHPPDSLRFLVLGDAGEGNLTQHRVGASMAALCAAKADGAPGCDFALYLGDNFYQVGVDDVHDPQFSEKFEGPYALLDLPFYVVLGNHDYGSGSLDQDRAAPQIAYTRRSTKWTLPARAYHFPAAHAHFLALDTNAAMLRELWGDTGQEALIDEALEAAAGATWTIGFGHHPYRSDGPHGNAGAYEGKDWVPIANGAGVQSLVESKLCGRLDLYFAGHDHSRQWLQPRCGMRLAISGAGAKSTAIVDRGNAPTFASASPGFLWVAIQGPELVAEFYDQHGNLEHTERLHKGG